MALVRIFIAATLAAIASLPAAAQGEGQCIVAGRINDAGQWAPRFVAVQLRGADGKVLVRADRATLANVRSAELAQPALLSRCDGNGELMRVPDSEAAGSKTAVPALSRGRVEVEAVSFPKLRTGGTLVELKVRAPAERVVMLTR